MTQLQNVNCIARKSADVYHLVVAHNWRMRRVIDRNGAVAWAPFHDFSTHYALSSSQSYVEATSWSLTERSSRVELDELARSSLKFLQNGFDKRSSQT